MAEDDNNEASVASVIISGEDDCSSIGGSSSSSDRPWIEDFEELCSSEDLSIEELHRMTNFDISTVSDDLYNSSFLHRACKNEKITLEMVEFLLDLNPQATNQCADIADVYPIVISAYPLHLACYNKECPNEVIELLLRKGDDLILSHIHSMDYDWSKTGADVVFHDDGAGGTPLHFYLSRTSNVDLGIVKRIVTANPSALLSFSDETKSTPIHILMNNKNIGEMFDVVEYIVESNPSSLQMKDQYNQTPLHVACANGYITVESVNFLLSVWVGALYELNTCRASPIHLLCEKNERGEEIDDEVATDILKLLLQVQPDLVSQINDFEDNEQIPLHSLPTTNQKPFVKF